MASFETRDFFSDPFKSVKKLKVLFENIIITSMVADVETKELLGYKHGVRKIFLSVRNIKKKSNYFNDVWFPLT